MKQKGFSLIELVLSLSILSVCFLVLATSLETQKQQKHNIQVYKSLYPFIEAFQWFFYNNPEEILDGIWLGYQTSKGKRKFLKQAYCNPMSLNYTFKIEVCFKDPFYKINFCDKTNRKLARFYWSKN